MTSPMPATPFSGVFARDSVTEWLNRSSNEVEVR